MLNQGNQKIGSTFLRPILILSGILLVLWLIALQQTDSKEQEEPLTAESQQRLDSLRIILGTTDTVAREEKEPDLFSNALPVFLVLVVFISALWLWSKKAKAPQQIQGSILAEQIIGPGQSIKAVKFAGEVYILGVTHQSITVLKTLSEIEWTSLPEMSTTSEPSAFSKLFKKETES
jgi:flagellar biogenesis protein FliO